MNNQGREKRNSELVCPQTRQKEWNYRVAEGIEEILKLIAPGTPIRNGLENILNAKTGALIAIADNEEVLKLVDRGI